MLSGVKAFLFLFCLCTTMLSKSFRPAIIFARRKTKPCHPERSRSACDGEVEGPRRWWYSPCSFREFLRCTVPVTCPRTVHGNAFPGRKNGVRTVWQNTSYRHEQGRILGVLRLPLCRFAPSESLRMTVYGGCSSAVHSSLAALPRCVLCVNISVLLKHGLLNPGLLNYGHSIKRLLH